MFKRGELLKLLETVRKSALSNGSLIHLNSKEFIIKSNNISFQLRILSSLNDKINETTKQKKENRNPFLPYEKSLFITNITNNHVVILNKFAVLNNHALIITKDFVEQTKPLLRDDFYAIHSLLQENNGLIFFNCGTIAGASQKHKHIQFLPNFPLIPNSNLDLPISELFDQIQYKNDKEFGILPYFSDFIHYASNFSNDGYNIDLNDDKYINYYADRDYNLYFNILQALSFLNNENSQNDSNDLYLGPYNFILTRKCMLVVPRSKEYFNGVSVNSIGIAGGILVKNEEQKTIVEETGFLNLLKHLTFSSNE